MVTHSISSTEVQHIPVQLQTCVVYMVLETEPACTYLSEESQHLSLRRAAMRYRPMQHMGEDSQLGERDRAGGMKKVKSLKGDGTRKMEMEHKNIGGREQRGWCWEKQTTCSPEEDKS